MEQTQHKVIILDGESLTIEDLVSIESEDVKVDVPDDAWKRVREGKI